MNKHIVMGVHFHISEIIPIKSPADQPRFIIINVYLIQVICFFPILSWVGVNTVFPTL